MSAAELAEYVDHFQRRILQEAMQEATRAFWLRRAADFEWARPSLGEYCGRADRDELRSLWVRNTETAKACRAKAEMALLEDVPEVDEVLGEVAA